MANVSLKITANGQPVTGPLAPGTIVRVEYIDDAPATIPAKHIDVPVTGSMTLDGKKYDESGTIGEDIAGQNIRVYQVPLLGGKPMVPLTGSMANPAIFELPMP